MPGAALLVIACGIGAVNGCDLGRGVSGDLRRRGEARGNAGSGRDQKRQRQPSADRPRPRPRLINFAMVTPNDMPAFRPE